jgi:hypothetical protein
MPSCIGVPSAKRKHGHDLILKLTFGIVATVAGGHLREVISSIFF